MLSTALKSEIEEVVKKLPPVFNAQHVIAKLRELYRADYEACSKDYGSWASFNGQISSYVSKMEGIEATGKVRAENMNHAISECMGYRKV